MSTEIYLTPTPIPDRLLPRWCVLLGIQVSPMQLYCTSIKENNRLPRGSEKRLKGLRERILTSLRGSTSKWCEMIDNSKQLNIKKL